MPVLNFQVFMSIIPLRNSNISFLRIAFVCATLLARVKRKTITDVLKNFNKIFAIYIEHEKYATFL